MDKYQHMSEDEEDLIPDEFSDDNVEDMDEFIEKEEEFEARQSISSRGSIGRATKDRRTDVQRYDNHQQVCISPPICYIVIYYYISNCFCIAKARKVSTIRVRSRKP